MNAELSGYAEHIQFIKSSATVLTAPLSVAQLAWKPNDGAWSIADCFDHLNTVGFLLMPRLEEAVRSGRKQQLLSEGPFRYGFLGRWFVRSLRPDAKRKLKTPALYRPSEISEPRTVLRRFDELQVTILELLRTADGLDLKKIRVSSPASALLRFSLGVWFASTVAHQHRHLAQAERVRSAASFPSA